MALIKKPELVLFQPDIPQNCGTMLRLCACLDVNDHIIEPCGFIWDDMKLRRAGMDYLNGVRSAVMPPGRNFLIAQARKGGWFY